jgi:hypothetical protein
MSAYTDAASLIPARLEQRPDHDVPGSQSPAGFAKLERQKAEASSYDIRQPIAVASIWLAFYIILFVHHFMAPT